MPALVDFEYVWIVPVLFVAWNWQRPLLQWEHPAVPGSTILVDFCPLGNRVRIFSHMSTLIMTHVKHTDLRDKATTWTWKYALKQALFDSTRSCLSAPLDRVVRLLRTNANHCDTCTCVPQGTSSCSHAPPWRTRWLPSWASGHGTQPASGSSSGPPAASSPPPTRGRPITHGGKTICPSEDLVRDVTVSRRRDYLNTGDDGGDVQAFRVRCPRYQQ
ncbi:hypothetical protein IFM47457_08327 [Aspergillus lentulus]|uniref:Uncharacterized protein n=1 Tax=Aspergillus lentulus TaxID=293939 RepID=A0ABQ1AV87_ASPLE|nr:hypothetical protein CNMCM7927_007875 [Aspergillus lentulus]GFF67286.1 hypothetical protein IFM62136_06903 [Aspergillus lentulus]GFF88688.1 hypothetical protein IFM60648_08472 [Aspergillus lentulus]GFF89966.1 hypothetical protein IFM47457_08327 [Aspergillus lentulus]